MANPELGAKQICPACQSKFYDLGRRPATCPKCGNSFDPEEAIRSRRARTRSAAPEYEADDETDDKARKAKAAENEDGFEDEVEETPEIDEAPPEPLESDDDADDPVSAPDADPSLGVDFEEDAAEEDADDVPFLEEEDEDFPDDEIDGIPGPDEEER